MMAEVTLTAAQQAVVDCKYGPLLVSAAAGSGKTKVLVDRVMKKLLDPDDPADIDEFLIITFSNAAAAELRAKIAKELSEKLLQMPENRHLQKQLVRIHLAQISTVHAFCGNLLREWFHVCDLPCDFRVAQDAEIEEISKSVLNGVLEDCYQKLSEDDDLRRMIDRIGYGRDDRLLYDVLLRLYEKASCSPDPMAWLDRCVKAAELENVASAEQTVWGKYLIEVFGREMNAACAQVRLAIELASQNIGLNEKYVPAFCENLTRMEEYAKQSTWNGIFENKITDFVKCKNAPKGTDPVLKDRVSGLHNNAKKTVDKVQNMFYAPSEQIIFELRNTASVIRGLVKVLHEYDKRFIAEKRRRKLLDFSDLEHEAVRLLTDSATGKPTVYAKEIASRFREIMVDEYQDSNAVQECIFQALSADGENRFMVGDIKQSIYRFRLADPTIFLEKYEQYPFDRDASDDEGRKIVLSENFRSRKEILQAVNDVFSLVMCKQSGEIDYTDDQKLKKGATPFDDTPQPKVELHCISTGKDDFAVEDEKPENAIIEAEFVARRIKKLLSDGTTVQGKDGLRPARAEDIAIIMRSPGNVVQYFSSALQSYGIACKTSRDDQAILSTELQTACALLDVVDNPHQDIPLLTVLAGPVFAFSADMLAQARSGKKTADFFTSLCENADKDPKFAEFLSWLTQMREQVKKLPLRELIGEIFRTTDLENIFASMENGSVRLENLQRFKAYAASYENDHLGGLGKFCRNLRFLKEQNKDIPKTESQAGENAVQIVSIHGSKGLEYPIVILANLCKRFNTDDLNTGVLIDTELFIGCENVDAQKHLRYASVSKLAVADKMKRQLVAEEMRLLYVAMTRAKEMLIMTCASATLNSRLKGLNSALSVPLRPDVSANVGSLADWVLLAALCRTEAGELFAVCGENDCSSVHAEPWIIQMQSAEKLRNSIGRANAKTQSTFIKPIVFDRKYAHGTACMISSKLTATELKGRNLDAEAAEETAPSAARYTWRKPIFSEKKELLGRERGNATHLFMQYVRYENCADADGISREKKRLLENRFLTEQQLACVNERWISELFACNFGKRILRAKDVRREFKFSIFTDASEYFPNVQGENVMLQGVVDCFWIEDGKLVIVDFKTDRVSGNLNEKAAHYQPQIKAYAKALSEIYQMEVKETILYFFDAGQAVSV